MKSKIYGLLILAFVLGWAGPVKADDPTSKFVPLASLPSALPPGSTGIAVQLEVWDQSSAGTMVFSEAHTVDTDAGSNITNDTSFADLLLGRPGGLNAANFPANSSRYLDVAQGGISVLTARIPIYASIFSLTPGPQGPQGIQGPPGQQGPPGAVQTVTAGDSSVTVGGTAADRLVSIAPNGVTNANVANGALSAVKITGTAATLGSNAFLGLQAVQTATNSYGITHTDGVVTVGSWVGTDISGPVGGYLGTRSNHPLFFFTNNGYAQMTLSTAGNLGIGTTAPTSARLVVTNTSGGTAVRGQSNGGSNFPAVHGVSTGLNGIGVRGESDNGALAVGLYGSSTIGYAGVFNGRTLFQGNLNIPALGVAGDTPLCRNNSGSGELATCSSSFRYKTDVRPFLRGLDIVERLRPIAFTWKQGGSRDIGLGAEEVEKVEPLLTFRNDKGEIEGVKYNQLSAVFVNAFAEQQAQIGEQKQIIIKLLERIAALEKMVERSR